MAGNEIWVARGTYYPDNSGLDRSKRFIIPDGVSLYGGFAGTETERDQRDWSVFVTELSGDINRTGNLFGNSHTVVDVSNTSPTTLIDGFIISRGNAEGLAIEGYPLYNTGAGIFNSGGSPVIRNCIISRNSGIQGAGMANIFEANPTLINVTFRNNFVPYPGGGAGMLNSENSNPLILSCRFENNESEQLGGAIINTFGSSPEIRNSLFLSNRALNGAAISSNDSSICIIVNSEFRGNVAGWNGGAIAASSKGEIIIENCLFAGNRGRNGGAIHNENGVIRLFNCTLVGNIAEEGGAAFANEKSLTRFNNSIVWNNRSHNDSAPDFGAIYHNDNPEIVSFSHSIINGSYAPNGWNVELGIDFGENRSYDPLFENPSSSLGIPFTDGNYRLTKCSPAVNFGSNQLIRNLSITDLQGNPRIIDDIVDIGAYEFEGDIPPPVISCNDFVIELNFQTSISFDVNEFYEIIDSCGPISSTIFDFDSLILDCSMVGSNVYTIIATDLFTELSDTCEVTIEIENPTYTFTINEMPLIPGDTLSICPGAPLELGIDSIMFPAAPIHSEFRINESGELIHTSFSPDQSFTFYYNELGVYQLQFYSIQDANGCLVEGEEAEKYHYFFKVEIINDTSYHSSAVCIGEDFRNLKIHSDTVLHFMHLSTRGCDSLEIVEISVYDSPELKIEGDSIICGEETGMLRVAENFERIEWSLEGHQGSEIQVSQSGELSVVVLDSHGCIFSDMINVQVLEPFKVTYDIGPANCLESGDGFIAVNDIAGGLPPYQYEITDDNGLPLNNNSELDPGWYQLHLMDSNNCIEQINLEIPVLFNPMVEIISPNRINKGDSLSLKASHSFPHQVDLHWYVNDIYYLSSSQPISLKPKDDIELRVLIVDSLGCKAEDLRFVLVYEPIEVYIPNAFSPNNDGVNDRLGVFTRDEEQLLSFRIFDRWGAVIFERTNFSSNNQDYGWDGKFRGQLMPKSEYLYQLKLLDDGEIRQFIGTVLLLR